jgi:hypothetical protein
VRQDRLTGALSARAWEQALAAENDRCRRHDGDAVVVVVHLASPAEDLRDAAAVIRGAIRAHDIVARPSPSELALLAVSTGAGGAGALEQRVFRALAENGLRAGVSAVRRGDVGALDTAWATARHRMLRRGEGARTGGH